jgi:hypothetical protein
MFGEDNFCHAFSNCCIQTGQVVVM